MHSLILRPCTTEVLSLIPFPEGLTAWSPWYAISASWHEAEFALAPGMPLRQIRVRKHAVEFQMPFRELLKVLRDFEPNGLNVYLMDRPFEGQFDPDQIPEEHRLTALAAHGLVAHFELPHRNEFACLSTPHHELYETWLADESVKQLVTELPEREN